MLIAAVIPVKSFALAKGRLASSLTPSRRAELARDCATRVLRAASPFPVYVVCDDDEVAEWARSLHATVVRCDTPGLDHAVVAGRRAACHNGMEHIVVAHADLPLATRLDHVVHEGAVSMVPDRHRDGTNVLSFPAESAFVTAYGPDSFRNHVRIAERLGLHCVVVDDADLALDLDTADDLAELDRLSGRGGRTPFTPTDTEEITR